MTDRELMQQALDALEGYARNCLCEGGGAPCDAAEALRARLAQPEQEPVACVQDLDEVKRKHLVYEKGMDWKDPLYTTPPQRTWVGLSDAEIHNMTILMGFNPEWVAEVEIVKSIVRNLEAKLKEKNT